MTDVQVIVNEKSGFVHKEKQTKIKDIYRRNLTDKEIDWFIDQYRNDAGTIKLVYDEISKRRMDKSFKYSFIKQAVSMVLSGKFYSMGLCRTSAYKVAAGVVGALYDLYMAEVREKTAKELKERNGVLEGWEPAVEVAIPAEIETRAKMPSEADANVAEIFGVEKEEAKNALPIEHSYVNEDKPVIKQILEESDTGKKLANGIKKIGDAPKGMSLENAVIEAGKIKALMEMMDSYYYDYVAADASGKMEAFYCVFDIMRNRYEDFERTLQHMIYSKS